MTTQIPTREERLTVLVQRELPDGRFVVNNSSRRDIPTGTIFTDLWAERGNVAPDGQVVVRERVQGPDLDLRLVGVEFFRRSIESVPCGHHAAATFKGEGAEALRAFLAAHPVPWHVSLSSESETSTHVPSVCERVAEARGGELIVRIESTCVSTPVEAARLFGLSDSAVVYNEVSREEAGSVLVEVLVKDMAYGCPLVPPDAAADLADAFLRSVQGEDARYFTNGTFGRPRLHANCGPSWNPATEHTFDTGVLVLTTKQVGCAWFMDED